MPLRAWLLIGLLLAFAVSAIRPLHPTDFFIEHTLTAIALGLLIWADRVAPLSNMTVILLAAFGLLHILGAHYTYSEVPYDAWSEALLGTSISGSLGWQRNHYDRLVHLMFGLLLVFPARELLARLFPDVPMRSGRLLLVAVLLLATLSSLYEILEWLLTLVMTQDAAAMYNGEQGDIRDAHKDMTLAFVGSLISAAVILLVDCRRARSAAGGR